MVNNSGESEHPCFVPNFKGNTFSFCPSSMMLAVGFAYMAFIMLRYIPSIHTLLRVKNKRRGQWVEGITGTTIKDTWTKPKRGRIMGRE